MSEPGSLSRLIAKQDTCSGLDRRHGQPCEGLPQRPSRRAQNVLRTTRT
ncbi:hypothetical protein HMPREF9056_01577 [Actinomyces sp. oral taxon 170 str. F0386]|nr:hypothetical protein HMPREF9056_01577 [Actinomyces sp. oral taxon 170 str. F0386]